MFYEIDINFTIEKCAIKSRTKILLNNYHFYDKYRKFTNDIEKLNNKDYYSGK